MEKNAEVIGKTSNGQTITGLILSPNLVMYNNFENYEIECNNTYFSNYYNCNPYSGIWV